MHKALRFLIPNKVLLTMKAAVGSGLFCNLCTNDIADRYVRIVV